MINCTNLKSDKNTICIQKEDESQSLVSILNKQNLNESDLIRHDTLHNLTKNNDLVLNDKNEGNANAIIELKTLLSNLNNIKDEITKEQLDNFNLKNINCFKPSPTLEVIYELQEFNENKEDISKIHNSTINDDIVINVQSERLLEVSPNSLEEQTVHLNEPNKENKMVNLIERKIILEESNRNESSLCDNNKFKCNLLTCTIILCFLLSGLICYKFIVSFS
ncbi:hypothetical protein NAPIS_ORF02449 [Vairimorpha apis BRL 01]|uniref:Uncharacterized protein n=1 Tax=Vairimorpha apis BRL 01 TaxID=1037528 RepID=T0M9F0_9MICR|nr:hypothetical protein NAPIS_ORF02449 [Vairimorpha apis BRL 01]